MNILRNKSMTANQSVNRKIEKPKNAARGFTLIEMLVVIGIITVLIGASLASYSKVMKNADKTKTQELVNEVRIALDAIYEADGMWPKSIREASVSGNDDDGALTPKVALVLAKRGYLSLSADTDKTKLLGKDRFGVLAPWAAKVLDRKGSSATLDDVKSGRLRFAVDVNGDGEIRREDCGGRTGVEVIRATAAVWCTEKDGSTVQSWTQGQARKVE